MSQIAINVTGTTQGLQTAMEQAATASEKQMARLQRAVQTATRELKNLQIQQQAANSASASMDQATAAASRLEGGTSRVTRELIIMGHEAVTGNYKRLGGSLLVLAEYTNIAHLAFSGIGAAVLGGVAALGAFATAAISGALESEHFTKSLILTGNAAGLTTSSLATMARELTGQTNASILSARSTLEALAATGQFTPQTIGAAAKAVTALQEVTGETSEKVVGDYAKMNDGVAKWADEHNRAWHFLSAAQYQYIADLERQGRTEEAQLEVSKALYDHLGGQAVQKVGLLEQAWGSLGRVVSETWDKLKDIGRDETIDQKIAAVQAHLADLKRGEAFGGAVDSHSILVGLFGRDQASQEAQLRSLLAQKAAEDAKATQDAANAKTQEAAITATKTLTTLRDEIDKRDLATKKVEEYRRAIAAQQAAGLAVPSQQQQQTEIAAIRKRFDPEDAKAVKQLDDAYQRELQTLTAEGIKLDTAAANWAKYGKAVDTSRLAVLDLDIAQGKLKGLNPVQIGTLRGLASADDQKAEALHQTEAADAYAKKTRSMLAAATAGEVSARQSEIAKAIAELEASGVAKTSAAYGQLLADRTKAVNAGFDTKMSQALAQDNLRLDDQVKKLDLATQMIGLDEVSREKLTATMQLEDQAAQRILQDKDSEAKIRANLAQQIALETAAIDRNYAAQHTAQAGAAQALQKYRDAANDSAKFTETVVSDGLRKMEDAIVRFADTGKLSFKDLWQSMADEFLRQQIRMATSSILGSGGGGGGLLGLLSSGLSSIFGSSAANVSVGSVASAAVPLSASSLGSFDQFVTSLPGFADGLGYVPRDDFPARLHQGERVLTAAQARAQDSNGSGPVIHQNNNFGSNVTRADLQAWANSVKEQTKAAILDSTRHNGAFKQW